MLLSLIIFLAVLGTLVFVHELGHFLVAKKAGMRVDAFAIGFPPQLFGIRRGETLYAINLIPFGGYVKIHGEHGAEGEEPDPRAFGSKSLGARLAVMVAGVSMNLLFAFVVLTVAFSIGFASVGQDLAKVPGAKVKNGDVYISQILDGSAAAKAGLAAGDRFISLTDADGSITPTNAARVQYFTKQAQAMPADRAVTVLVDRNGTRKTVNVTLAEEGFPLGAALEEVQTISVPVWRAPIVAAKEIGLIIKLTWSALGQFASQLFKHAKLDPNVTGPVGIYKATASAAKEGVASVIFLMVSLSVNLALLNILPIPALDGGKVLFLLIELVARKKVISDQAEGLSSAISFAILILLILVLSFRDIFVH